MINKQYHKDDWANDIAKIAQAHIAGIRGITNYELGITKTPARVAFEAFTKDLRSNLNGSITDNEIIEMLAQHLITKPVFDALFAGHDFTQHNPISRALEQVLTTLHEHSLATDTAQLQGFYASVQLRAAGIDSAAGRQRIILELYDKFFRNAFPRLTERLGIVYTPVEVVDFILHSVDHLLRQEFGQNLGTPGVQILDPFTGAGAFITRLLQSGLISAEQLQYKYTHDIHANEIVLLAYYIAAINIESVFHTAITNYELGITNYVPFPNICLTDTFQLHESADLISELLVDNSTRRQRQKGLDIQVIIGNPPYSAGQKSANDNNQNVAYANLDERIRSTYAARSTAMLKNSLYDSYIRAIRWASDRIANRGIIGFVTNAGFLESNSADGLRRCLAEEFNRIVVLNLRGNIRKNMMSKGQAKEGQNIFGSDSMAGIAISLFIKNPNSTQRGLIEYYDIGDDLTREDKLSKISQLGNIAGIKDWQYITTDQHGDWLKQRDDNFNLFIPMGNKDGREAQVLFANYSHGIMTCRDAWCYNSSKLAVTTNMVRMIKFYNDEVARFVQEERKPAVEDFINTDATKISWTRALRQDLAKNRQFSFAAECLTPSLYRPFTKKWLYFNRTFNEMILQMPRIFPSTWVENRVICVSGNGAKSGFSALMTDMLPCSDNIEKGQCFPLYLYENTPPTGPLLLTGEGENIFPSISSTFYGQGDGSDGVNSLFPLSCQGEGGQGGGVIRRHAITDAALTHFRAAYPNHTITKEDIFYYTYALLHSPAYREQYADNLSRQLPRILCDRDFPHYTQAGRALAELHINYETAELYPVTITITPLNPPLTGGKLSSPLSGQGEGGQGGGVNSLYRVEKIRYGKIGQDKDLTTLIYNDHITLTGIPVQAYDYIINGKPALDWVIERQGIKTDKASGIVNDANAYALETMHNPKYPLELIQRIITVSLKTLRIVATL